MYLRVPCSNTLTLFRWVTHPVFSSNTVLTSSLRSISEDTQLVLNLVLYRSMSVEHEHTSNPIPNLNTVPSLKPKSKKLKFQLSLLPLSVVCTSCVWV